LKSGKTKKEKRYRRVGEKQVEWRDIFTLVKLPKKERTTRENKRVESFLEGKATIEALCTNKCKVCKRKIVAPSDFCGSECRRKYNDKKRKGSKR